MNENNWQTKWSKEQIRAMLREQFQTFWKRDTGVVREKLPQLLTAAALPHAVIISGLTANGEDSLQSGDMTIHIQPIATWFTGMTAYGVFRSKKH
jgi:hypothetical protein